MTVGALRFLDPGDRTTRRTWDEIARSSPGATVFHTTAWMDVVQHSSGATCRNRRPQRRCRARAANITRPRPRLANGLEEPSRPLSGSSRHSLARRQGHWRASGTPASATREISVEQAHIAGQRVSIAARNDRRGERLRPRGASLLRRHGHLGMPPAFFVALLRHLPGIARLASISDPHGRILAFAVTLWDLGRCDFLYGSGYPSKSGEDAYRVCLGSEIEAAIAAGLKVFEHARDEPGQSCADYLQGKVGRPAGGRDYLILAREGADCALHVDGKGFRPDGGCCATRPSDCRWRCRVRCTARCSDRCAHG